MKYTENIFGQPIIQNVLLRDKFMEPPFSVLDTKGGNWQARKRAWKSIGIKSEVGRDGVVVINNSFDGAAYGRGAMPEVSIFDPALTELMYRWFCPEGGTILDPFAGGSVRGIVANYLGYHYTGVDIRQEQIDSNREQALDILPITNQPQWYVGDSNVVLDGMAGGGTTLTPIEQHGDIFVKREDLFNSHGANGAKARTATFLIKNAIAAGYKGITTAGSRQSPQINIAAQICRRMGVPLVAHCPKGDLSPELIDAQAQGAVIIQHVAGYNNVIISRCRDYAKENNFYELPFGMSCSEAVAQTRDQVKSIPAGVKRIVISVGSGMNLAGLLHGLLEYGVKIPVIGISVGADATKTLDEFAPSSWREMVTIIKHPSDYHREELFNEAFGIKFDPIYEAKCLTYLQVGDLFWVVGIRRTLLPANTPENSYTVAASSTAHKYDMIFSCPPYADLEVYSADPADISNMPYEQFVPAYQSIIAKAVACLKPGGYAAWVVGDVRDKKGFYRDFIGDTKRAFINAGAMLYNDAVLLQPLGTAMLRADRVFSAGQKLIKVHENVLVFKKP